MLLDTPRLAVTLLTAIPLPRRSPAGPYPASAWRGVMAWAPAVGLLLGGAGAGVLWLSAHLLRTGPLLAAALALAALALLSRGLHLDGLADLADGLGSGRPAAAALDIMKKSDIGPFGVMTMIFTVLVQVSALARADELGRGVAGLLVAGAGSRLAMTWACCRGVPAARAGGLGARVAATVPPLAAAALTAAALGLAAVLGLAGPGSAWPTEMIFVSALAAGLAVSLGLAWHAVARLGGITGDVLGAVAEIAVAACLVVTAIG